MGLDRGLGVVVERFVVDVGAVLAAVADAVPGADRAALQADVRLEARNLVAAVIDADGRLTDDELLAYITLFGADAPETIGRATPAQLRDGDVVRGRASVLTEPTVLFELLVDAAVRSGGDHAAVYYTRALDLCHAVCGLDDFPATAELAAVDRYRAALLARMDAAGLPRPGARALTPPLTPPLAAPPAKRAGSPATRGDAWSGSGASSSGGIDETRPRILDAVADALGYVPKHRAATHAASDAGSAATSAEGTAGAEAAAPLPPPRPLDELYAELDALTGLTEVKREIRLVADLLKVQRLRAEKGLPTQDTSRHLVFTGNPGTGKTTVARLLAQIYRTLGVVAKGHLVETDRAGLVAEYVGHTAIKVTQRFDEADEGILLIDEAYALVRGGEKDFGREAIDTIVKLMEDRRDRVVLVAAGYPDEMDDFIAANPGLTSRFPRSIHFPDYTTDELLAIFDGMCRKERYEPDDAAIAKVRSFLDSRPRDKGFGNGRLVRNVFEAALLRQADRVADLEKPEEPHLVGLIAADIPDSLG